MTHNCLSLHPPSKNYQSNIPSWLRAHYLKLNSDKTELIDLAMKNSEDPFCLVARLLTLSQYRKTTGLMSSTVSKHTPFLHPWWQNLLNFFYKSYLIPDMTTASLNLLVSLLICEVSSTDHVAACLANSFPHVMLVSTSVTQHLIVLVFCGTRLANLAPSISARCL